jgi:hypothetical protein
MAASSLTAALMGGQGGNEAAMFGLDPAVAAATPDIQLGQALIQGGLSTAPASPWQALARVAQTGTGQYIKSDAISQLAKAYSGSTENMAKVFDQVAPGGIVSKMLRSPDPIVRMQGMQMAQKAGLQLNEPQEVRPNNTVGQPGGGQPLLTNPQPTTPAGQAQRDLELAGRNNPAAVPALTSAATQAATKDGYVFPSIQGQPGQPSPPSGPPRLTGTVSPTGAVPLPAPQKQGSILPNGELFLGPGAPPPSASIQNAPQPPAGAPPSAQPSAAQPPAATFNQRFAGTLPGYAENQATIAGAKAGAEETAKNQANLGPLLNPPGELKPGPGTTEPIKTASGTTIPPVSEQGALPTNPAQLKEAIPAWQKTETDWNNSIAPAAQAEQRLMTMAGAMKKVETGAFTTDKAAFLAGLYSTTGIKLPMTATVSDVQIAMHENVAESLQQLKATQPRFAQMEFKTTSLNKEGPNLTPEANLQMLSEDVATLRQAQNLPSDFTAAKANGWQNPQSFEQSWMKANPLSGYVQNVKKEIGPLKGMEGAQGPTKPGAYVWSPDGGIAPK